jgi:hypothetical protein
LEKEVEQENITKQARKARPFEKRTGLFDCTLVSCGVWSYNVSNLVFTPHWEWGMGGKVKLGVRKLTITIGKKQIQISYSGIHMLAIEKSTPTMTITCYFAPLFCEKTDETDLTKQFMGVSFNTKARTAPYKRLPGLDKSHEELAPICLVYRIAFSSFSFKEHMQKNDREMPVIVHSTRVQVSRESLNTELSRMAEAFATSHESMPFPIMFQLQRLAQNGYLSPSTVVELFPEMAEMAKRSGTAISVSALRKFFQQSE